MSVVNNPELLIIDEFTVPVVKRPEVTKPELLIIDELTVTVPIEVVAVIFNPVISPDTFADEAAMFFTVISVVLSNVVDVTPRLIRAWAGSLMSWKLSPRWR